MVHFWNEYIAPVIPYLLGIAAFIFVCYVITIDADDDDFMCDC